ncbi:hypothetical protein N7451_009402 [Penicillium sp. IBT 35674x]|nr:hypothetical protein N7451_009402 [Penicillium sp. IBT 35674x]
MPDSPGGNHDSEEAKATSYAPYENELISDSGRVQVQADKHIEIQILTTSIADGRVNINLESTVAGAIAESINYQQELRRESSDYRQRIAQASSFDLKLNIVIQIVGSRGDVQPFVALGSALQRHGHRVRIATHGVFADFIHSSGLEFFPIGGNPADLMAYMVKNPGLLPQMETLREGEICKKKIMIGEMLEGCWRSCIENDPYTQEPFVADAIIANPPSFAHIHCAQALSIPVHLMFTMPWSSTKSFPHPLSSLTADPEYKGIDCWASYGVVEWLTWQGLADVVNKWRASIDLSPIPTTEGPSLHEGLKIPFTYCWSPALVPKPQDWPAYIGICLRVLLQGPPEYDPSPELQEFLLLGTPPIYVGFGSIVVDEPEKLIDTVLKAVKASGARAVISKGWSNMNGSEDENIFYIGDCPHEWLFQHVAAVVHHGGAGTTACGLINGKPTAIVPFFGDQPFWGEMVASAGAGPRPIPHKLLTVHNLIQAIKFCLTPEATVAAQELAGKMHTECGVDEAVKSFHRNLPFERMRCMIIPDQVAVWNYRKNKRSLNLSKMAVQTLIEYSRIDTDNLQCHEINPITIENRRWDPLTGVISAGISTGTRMLKTSTGMLYEPLKELRRARTSPASERNQPTSGSSDNLSSLPSRSTTYQSDNDRPTSPRSPFTTAGDMAGASLNSFGKFTTECFKGVLVDIPTAAADGFRHVSQVYGDKPKDYGTVTDWKSGAKVGSKNFVGGMTEGITGLIKHPWKGYREDGRQGALRGLAKGAIGLATKGPSAGIGLWAYPSQGIARSIEAKFRGKTRKAVVIARLMDGYAQTIEMQLSEETKQEIVREFDRLMGFD